MVSAQLLNITADDNQWLGSQARKNVTKTYFIIVRRHTSSHLNISWYTININNK